MFPSARALLLMLCLLWPFLAAAHDPSAWGGIYRSRDNGATWFPTDAGLFIGGATGLSIDPGDPNHLLYGTDTRLLRSKNGGRDWVQEPGQQFAAPVYAVSFVEGGKGAIASTASRLFMGDGTSGWSDTQAPAGLAPARAIAAGARRLYAAGEHGIFISDDGGRNWRLASESLPDAAAANVIVIRNTGETVLALLQGAVWASEDEGATWTRKEVGSGGAQVDALAFDGGLWAAMQDRIYASSDGGTTWRQVGNPLPERDTTIRGIAVADAGNTIVLTTHRGVMRSTDGGKVWSIVEGALPVHLEAGPLIRDPHDAATMYAGFSLTPYSEVWRRASGGENLMAQLDPVSLAGASALLILLIVSGSFGVRWLIRARA